MAREQGAEGRLWPVVIALALSALVGSAIGWFLLSAHVHCRKDSSLPAGMGLQRPLVRRQRS